MDSPGTKCSAPFVVQKHGACHDGHACLVTRLDSFCVHTLPSAAAAPSSLLRRWEISQHLSNGEGIRFCY